jgi:eukaryotic-like serine/threonine-protein kinase
MPLANGTRVGPYEITGFIGAGGMGEVFRARDTRLNRDVAIKLLPVSFAADQDRLRRFTLEAQSASALNHPNILTVHDVGAGEQPYLVTELLEGESLSERLKRGKLSVNRAIDYAKQIAAGLAAAHAKGITHRDIKPDNLYLTKDGRVKILDFGLAKMASAPVGDATVQAATNAGTVMGTAAYMSPEQARGQAVDQRSDIFSFGCVLYEMLAGHRVFTGPTTADLMSAILTQDADVSVIEPAGLQRIVAHCLEKSPEQRFQSASDIGFALEAVSQLGSGANLPVAAPPPKKGLLPWAVAGVLALALVGVGWLHFRPKPEVRFQRITFRRGTIHTARFTPDGNSVIYSAKWEDEPSEVFTARFDSAGSRPLGFPATQLRAVSATGELALAQKTQAGRNGFAPNGMLARAPLSGGAPRSIEDKIDFADWSPDGKQMAVVRETDQWTQLEFPTGKVLFKTAGYIGEPRISPSGGHIAFLDHPRGNDNGGSVAVVDLAGNLKTLASGYLSEQGLAWSPNGDEVWFTAAKTGDRQELRAVTLAGRERVVFRQSVSIALADISRDGRILLANLEARTKAMFRGASDTAERELSWLDWSLATGISPDGKFLVISESGEGAGAEQQIFLRETSGAPAVLLGPAGGLGLLSSDSQSVVTVSPDLQAILIYPVGPGGPKRIPLPKGYTVGGSILLADGKTVAFTGNEPGHGERVYLTDLSGAKPRALTPEGVSGRGSLDGRYFLAVRPEGFRLYPTDGGAPQAVAGMSSGERAAGWSPDDQEVFVFNRNGIPAKVFRVNWKTGRRELLREIAPADRAGLEDRLNSVVITPDGKNYAYSFTQVLSELYLVEGLK